ncbi:MAG: tetratricopeptide repeat protein [Elusimicrobia bacterium]|nr:tetratricopeptide repeat protein [Elusimicrobiota bacterium]
MKITKIFLFLFTVCCLLFADVVASSKISYLHFMNGLVLERKGNYGEALQEYKTTLVLDPQAVFVYKQAMNLALHIGKVEEADNWARHVVEIEPGSPDNRVLYGNVQWAKGDIKEAVKAFEKALELDRENANAIYQLASIHSGADPEKSIQYLKKYLKFKPDDAPDIHYQIAILYNMKGNTGEMKKHLLNAMEKDSMYLQPRYMLAQHYENVRDTASALNQYLEILAIDFKNAELLNHIGELYVEARQFDKAEFYFLRAYEIKKGNSVGSFWLAVINEQRKDFAAAAGYLLSSENLKKDPSITLRLSYYLTQSGKYIEAVSMLEDAHKLWPEDTEISYFLSLGYDDLKKTKQALELLKSIIEKNPDERDARMQYAVISEREDNITEAEKHFNAILEKEPSNAVVLNYLGYALADRGLKLDEAEKYIVKAVELDPVNGAYLDSLGWVHFKQGKYEKAFDEIKTALKHLDNDPVIWEHMGSAHSALGEHDSAWKGWKIAKALGAKNGKLDDFIKGARKNIKPEEFGAMLFKHIKTFSSGFLKYSGFCKIEIEAGSKKMKFDGMINFKAPDELKVTIMGPLMAPLWNIALKSGRLEMDSISIKGINEMEANRWAALFVQELADYFSGLVFNAETPRLKQGWSSLHFLAGRRKLYPDKNQSFVEEMEPVDADMKIRFSDYKFYNGHFVPESFELKAKPFTLKLRMKNPAAEFETIKIAPPEEIVNSKE